ncbi:vitamin K epoxide reductase family protein [Hanstruepera marina]|uniref:vitamin K epoxide reductase family protein n=1 Tax=Hanstruepera marina TaxID=2873265 RepID=UPI001CA663D7|nr:vitamin K epoxide reductase family protein [Hanstruepera marina]
MDNCISSFVRLLKILKIKHTVVYSKETLLSHPDYPSMISIVDGLDHYGIESAAIKIDKSRLKELPLPCIIQVKTNNKSSVLADLWFYVLEKIEGNTAICYNHENEEETMVLDDLNMRWTGVTLLVEKTESSIEPGYTDRIKKSRITKTLSIITLSLALFWVFNLLKAQEVMVITYFLLKFTGLLVSVLLLWYEIDKFNPALQKFCSGDDKMSCEEVLDSKFAKLFGENFSLSSLSFSYFSSGILLLIFTSFSSVSLSLLWNLGLFALPIVIYSMYSQAFVVRRWCRLCLIVLSVLVLENVLYFRTTLSSFENIDIRIINIYATLFLFFAFASYLIKPLILEKKRTTIYKRSLARIKNKITVFETLLTESSKIKNSPKGLGIFFKSDKPKYHVLKVCNPYCEPCAQAHPILEKLLKKGIIDLQIIFTASGKENDIRSKPVRHLLAIESQGDLQKTKKALDDWYLPIKKDYLLFSQLYPVNGEINQQNKKIKAMYQWCYEENIMHTPAIYINGYELPNDYSLNDLLHLLDRKYFS